MHQTGKPMNYFTASDQQRLILEYKSYRDKGDLKVLASFMGRTVPFITRKAKDLGLTDASKRISMKCRSKEIAKARTEFYKTNEHPRGMKGKKHSASFSKKQSISLKKAWADPDSTFNTPAFRQIKSDTQSKNMFKRLSEKPQSQYSNAKNGVVKIGDKTFFARSAWESNAAAYFQLLKMKGEILDWQYEPKTFWFLAIKRGVRSYKPDFLITKNDGTQYYEEVKGWMDPKSKTKLNRMRIYHPEIEIRVLDQQRYAAIKKMSAFIPQWGILDKASIKDITLKCCSPDCIEQVHSKGLCRKHFYIRYKK